MGSLEPWTSGPVLCDKHWEVGNLARTPAPTGCGNLDLSELSFPHPKNGSIILIERIKWDSVCEKYLKIENL